MRSDKKMESVMRRSGIDVIGDVPWGTHFCQFYETSQDLIDTLVPYFRKGLKANEFCMWVTSEPLKVDQATAALKTAVPDLDDYIDKGQIEILDYSQWYTRSGKFSADEVLLGWVDKLTAAQKRGYEGLRLTGNTFWLEQADWDDFTRYEEAVNNVIGRYRMLAICTYSLQKCSAVEMLDVVANHQFALIKRSGQWEVVQSAKYKKTEQALRQSEEKWSGLYHSMGEGVALHEIVYNGAGSPADYIITDVNPSFEKITGLSRDKALGQRASALYGTGEPPFLDIYSRVASSGEPEWFEVYFEPMGKHFSISVFSPARGRFATVFSDITERKLMEESLQEKQEELEVQAEELEAHNEELRTNNDELFEAIRKLQESEAKYRNLFMNMTEEVHFWRLVRDEEGRIKTWRLVDANPPTLKTWGKTIDEIKGKTTDEIFGPGATEHYMPVVQKIMAEGIPYSFEDYFSHLDKYFRFTSVPLGDYFITTGADITGIKKSQEELCKARDELEQRVVERTAELSEAKENLEVINEELQVEISEHENTEKDLLKAKEAAEAAAEAKAAFLANMSHELRTPMNAVIGFSSLLLDEDLTPDQRDYVERIKNGGEALLAIISDILDISKAEKEKIELEHRPLSLKHCIEESLDMVAVQAEKKGLNLAYTVSYGTPDTIIGDHGRLRQILTNLLSNAVKFTDVGDISVSVSSKALEGDKCRITFTVKDTGIGMPKDKMDRLFLPFSQLEYIISRKRDGAGLGLAICKRLVELMGGEIWAESEEGKGSTFRFAIQAVAVSGEQLDFGETGRDHIYDNLSEQKPLSILVAEDNPSNQRVLVEMLKRMGYKPDAVADGKEVLQILGIRPYDLVLMDIKMPEMDGLTAAREIRRLWPDNGPKIVAITAFAMQGDREKCLEAGMDDYIAKPVQKKDLEAILVKNSGACRELA